MGIYDPDMRMMFQTREPRLFLSYARYKTEKGAQSFCQSLLKRKPKAGYKVTHLVTGDYAVYVEK